MGGLSSSDRASRLSSAEAETKDGSRTMGALEGKIAIITGGTSGIGERITELFVEQGAKVVVGARREAEGAALARRFGIDFIRTDVAIEAEVKAMIDLAA